MCINFGEGFEQCGNVRFLVQPKCQLFLFYEKCQLLVVLQWNNDMTVLRLCLVPKKNL